MFAWRAFPSRGEHAGAAPGAYLTVPALRSAGIRVAFTTRLGGRSGDPFASLNLSYVSGDDPGTVAANRARALAALGASLDAWTSGKQVHGAHVARVGRGERGRGARSPDDTLPGTDGLVTDEPGTALAVLTADCVPVLLADPARRTIGVAHAGWRGLVAGVVERTVEELGAPDGVRAYVGPSIGPCCYEVGPEVSDAARAALGDDVARDGRLDLWRGTVVALRRAGVRAISVSALCTRSEPHRFYSHRAGDAARQGLVAMVEP